MNNPTKEQVLSLILEAKKVLETLFPDVFPKAVYISDLKPGDKFNMINIIGTFTFVKTHEQLYVCERKNCQFTVNQYVYLSSNYTIYAREDDIEVRPVL